MTVPAVKRIRPPAVKRRRPVASLMETDDGGIVILSGASRQGKSAYAVQHFGQAPRAMAWDPEGQWCRLPGWQRLDTKAAVGAACARRGPGRYAYVPAPGLDLKAAFAWWCECAWVALNECGPIVIIAEELADVTTPGKAPAHWGTLSRRGIKRGAVIVAISQRWAESDKTALGNATEYVVFRLPSPDDARYLAQKTRMAFADLVEIPYLHFIRYDCKAQIATPGRLPFAPP